MGHANRKWWQTDSWFSSSLALLLSPQESVREAEELDRKQGARDGKLEENNKKHSKLNVACTFLKMSCSIHSFNCQN